MLTKGFINNIQKKVNRARGDTHDDEYFITVCKFFMQLFGLNESDCDE